MGSGTLATDTQSLDESWRPFYCHSDAYIRAGFETAQTQVSITQVQAAVTSHWQGHGKRRAAEEPQTLFGPISLRGSHLPSANRAQRQREPGGETRPPKRREGRRGAGVGFIPPSPRPLREAGRLQLHGQQGRQCWAVLGCTITSHAARRDKGQLQYKNLPTLPVGGL